MDLADLIEKLNKLIYLLRLLIETRDEDVLIAELEMAYLTHKQSLLAVAQNITRCQALAEDAIQIAFAKLVQKQLAATDLKAYIFMCVRNAAIDIVRKQKLESEIAESFFESPNGQDANSQIDSVIQDEQRQQVKDAIDSLPQQDREIILLKVYSGFTFEKVAEITKSSTSTVATRYRRLLEKLKSRLKKNDE